MDNAARAALFLEREHLRFVQHPVWGIDAKPMFEDNMFVWKAKIRGLKNSIWEDGVFYLKIKFSEHFDVQPPEVCFHTIPFHPNINPVTGQPCVDFLDDFMQWNETISVAGILMTIQTILSEPSLVNPVHPAAAALYRKNPEAYEQIARECVENSLQFDSIADEGSIAEFEPQPLTSTDEALETSKEDITESGLSSEESYIPQSVKQLSFDQYRSQWSNLATTRGIINPKTQMKLMMRGKPLESGPEIDKTELTNESKKVAAMKAQEALLVSEMTKYAETIRQKHNNIYYGVVNHQCVLSDRNIPKEAELTATSEEDLFESRTFYRGLGGNIKRLLDKSSQKEVRTRTPMSLSVPSAEEQIEEEEPQEDEVDQLVDWTKKLDSNGL